MKLIVAGCRHYSAAAYPAIERAISTFQEIFVVDEIVSGCATGADALGELWAEKYGFKPTPFPADWDKLGRGAGHARNAEMAKYGDAAIVLWDGETPGSKNMIEQMVRRTKIVMVFFYREKMKGKPYVHTRRKG